MPTKNRCAWKEFLAGCLVIFLPALAAAEAGAQAQTAGTNPPRQWNFEATTASALLRAWKPLRGKWKVVREPEHPANRVLKQGDERSHPACFLSRGTYTNFSFSVRVRTDTFEQQSRNWQLGILFRRRSPDHLYKLRLSTANVALIRMSPGALEIVTGGRSNSRTAGGARTGKAQPQEQLLLFLPLNVKRDSWHTLGVQCLGEGLTVDLDGKALKTLADPGVGSGAVGLYSMNTRAFFDDVRLDAKPVPELGPGLTVEPKLFRPVRDRELLVYYRLPEDTPLTLRVLEPDGKVFNLLTKGFHSAGINSVVWDGRGLTGRIPETGTYTFDLEFGGRSLQTQARVENDIEGKEY